MHAYCVSVSVSLNNESISVKKNLKCVYVWLSFQESINLYLIQAKL